MGTVPVKLKGPNIEITTYALLDNGSDSTFVRSSLLKRLGVIGSPGKLRIKTLTGEKNLDCERVNFRVEAMSEDYALNLTKLFTSDNLLQGVKAESPAKAAKRWNHLKGINFDDIGTKNIDLLIGLDNTEVLWVIDQRVGKGKQPFTIKSGLGWLLLGPNSDKGKSTRVRTTMTEDFLGIMCMGEDRGLFEGLIMPRTSIWLNSFLTICSLSDAKRRGLE